MIQCTHGLGVGASGLTETAGQLRLFEMEGEEDSKVNEATRQRRARLDATLDRIRERFGDEAIQRASLLDEPEELWVSRTGTALEDDA
jgi:hypothetical protein